MSPAAPAVVPLRGPFGMALTIDVEEWYHTCHVPEFVDPARRPRLAEELDRLLPELLATLAEHRRGATFFVLGEVAARLPARVREIAAAGHEVACHGYLHLRAGERSPAAYREDLRSARLLLEDLLGVAVAGHRAPEWSLRSPANPRLEQVLAAGFSYDSSLAPCLGAGRRANPRLPYRLAWPAGTLVELPPLTFAGAFQLPACGWTGRLAGPRPLAAAARALAAAGGLPVLTVHPWEVDAGSTPGELTGLARFLHETRRRDFARDGFPALLRALPLTSLEEALALRAGTDDEAPTAPARPG